MSCRCLISFLTNLAAMVAMSQQRTLITREELTERCSSLLVGYRTHCAQASRATQVGDVPTSMLTLIVFHQLIIPEAFRALPAFTLALQKTKPLKGNDSLSYSKHDDPYFLFCKARQVSSDVRNYHIHRILTMSPRTLMFHLYPRLVALHDLHDSVALLQAVETVEGTVVERMTLPSCSRNSYCHMESGGVYLIGMWQIWGSRTLTNFYISI